MFNRKNRATLYASLIFCLVSGVGGCKKAEQAKEESKPVEQKEAGKGSTLLQFNFENGKQGWGTHKILSVVQDKGKQHSGAASLKLSFSGTSGLWNIAASPSFQLSPGKKYKLSGWMLVDSFSTTSATPSVFFKVGLYEGKTYLKGINAATYDLAKKGSWQSFSADFETAADSNLTGNITVEKRPKDADLKGDIYLDDISLVSY